MLEARANLYETFKISLVNGNLTFDAFDTMKFGVQKIL